MKKNLSFSFLLLVILISFQEAVASETNGSILAPSQYARVCYDSSCSSSSTINFLPSGNPSVSITDTAITGYAWGSQLGWINFFPSGAGVTVDPNTGKLYGSGWSQVSGWINFRPSNADTVSNGLPIGVRINEQGEWYGWAWTGGNYGGWIKFDCSIQATCVKTDWRMLSLRSSVNGPVTSGGGGFIYLPTENTSTQSTTTVQIDTADQEVPHEEVTNPYNASPLVTVKEPDTTNEVDVEPLEVNPNQPSSSSPTNTPFPPQVINGSNGVGSQQPGSQVEVSSPLRKVIAYPFISEKLRFSIPISSGKSVDMVSIGFTLIFAWGLFHLARVLMRFSRL